MNTNHGDQLHHQSNNNNNNNSNYSSSSSSSPLDLNLDMLLFSARTPKQRSAAELKMMDALVPDEDLSLSAATSESSSSVINAPTTSDDHAYGPPNVAVAAASSPALVFDIFRKENTAPPPLTTPSHQLASTPGLEGLKVAAAAAPTKPWLKLLEADSSPAGTGHGGGVSAPAPAPAPQPRKSRRGPRSKSSQYRGVTFYRRTGRWESHIWDCGKQVYLGGFDTAHAAARAYDRAAIKFRGVEADINFALNDYEQDMKQMKDLSKEEFVHVLRRQSTGFSRGSSKSRGGGGGGRCRMGHLLPNKGNYDKAGIEQQYNGSGAVLVTNFQPMELCINDTTTTTTASTCCGDVDLALRLGISTSLHAASGINNISNNNPNFIMEPPQVRPPLLYTEVEKSRHGGGGGFGVLHGLPIASNNNNNNNNFPTWPPTFQGRGTSNNNMLSSWAQQQQQQQLNVGNIHKYNITGAVNVNFHDFNAVTKWSSTSQQLAAAAASSGFPFSFNNNNNINDYHDNINNNHKSAVAMANPSSSPGISSSSVNPSQPNNHYSSTLSLAEDCTTLTLNPS